MKNGIFAVRFSMSAQATQKHILDEAEIILRESGYLGLQLDLLAESIGVTSVRTHFGSEDELAYWVLRRYIDRFFENLGPTTASKDPARSFVMKFQDGLDPNGLACLCGMLELDRNVLSAPILQLLQEFEKRSRDWLGEAILIDYPANKSLAGELAELAFDAMRRAMGFAARHRDGRPLWRVGDVVINNF